MGGGYAKRRHPEGRGGTTKGLELGPGSLFWQAGGAALQDRSHWQVRMSEPSSS